MEERYTFLVRPADGVRTPHPEVNALAEARAGYHRATPRNRRYHLHFALHLYRLKYHGLTSHFDRYLYLYLPLYLDLDCLDDDRLASYLNRHFNRDDTLDNSLLTRNDDRDRLRRAASHYAGRDQRARDQTKQPGQAQLVSFHLS